MKEQTRDEFRPALLEDLLRDLRYGLRMLRRAPAFSTVAILTLALGIGAAAAVFSVVNGVLLRPLPYPDPDRIAQLFQVDQTGRRGANVSEPNFEDWKNGTRSFSAMAEMSSFPTPVRVGDETTLIPGAAVSRDAKGSPHVGSGARRLPRRGTSPVFSASTAAAAPSAPAPPNSPIAPFTEVTRVGCGLSPSSRASCAASNASSARVELAHETMSRARAREITPPSDARQPRSAS